MKQTIAIAVSGGIDSLVSAYLLKKQGYHVIGIHFLTGYETEPACQTKGQFFSKTDTQRSSPNKKSAADRFAQIENQIGIQVKIIDCSTEFKKKVVDYFIQTYLAGKTPNPCLVCNPSIKFGTLLDLARELGATHLATGHYARTKKDSEGRFHLFRGIDTRKDQSYFLAFLTQEQLSASFFPLGNLTKSEVKKLAQKIGLKPIIKQESQDVCFIKGNTYGEFLLLQTGFEAEPGLIQDVQGNIIGRHKGLHIYTIGQRRGINCPASEPYYVVRIDVDKNRLVVGFKKDLLSSECRIEGINWINQTPDSPIEVKTRLRYRSDAVPSTLLPENKHHATIKFKNPQMAITPGQGAVFYQDDEVLGGGWIGLLNNEKIHH